MADLLDNALPPVTLKDMIACVDRELKLRDRVYPRLVSSGRMKPAEAREQTRRMQAVLAMLKELEEAQAPVSTLKDAKALVLYHTTAEDRAEFEAAFREIKPHVRTVKLP